MSNAKIFWNKQQLKYGVKFGWLDPARTAFYNLLNCKILYHAIAAYLYSLELSNKKLCDFALFVNDRHFYKALFEYRKLQYAVKGYLVGKTQIMNLVLEFSKVNANKVLIMGFDFFLAPENDYEVAGQVAGFNTEVLLQLQHAESYRVRLAVYTALSNRNLGYLEPAVNDKDFEIRMMAIRKLDKAGHWKALFDDAAATSDMLNEATEALANCGEYTFLRQRMELIARKFPYYGLSSSFGANSGSKLFEKERKAAESFIQKKFKVYLRLDDESLWEAAAKNECFDCLKRLAQTQLEERKKSKLCSDK